MSEWVNQLRGWIADNTRWFPWAIIRVILTDALVVFVLLKVLGALAPVVDANIHSKAVRDAFHRIEYFSAVGLYAAVAFGGLARLVILIVKDIWKEIRSPHAFPFAA